MTDRPSVPPQGSSLLQRIMPSFVVTVDTFEDTGGAALFREERAVVERAVDKRRREFETGRTCAREALQRLGRPPAPLLPGRHGEPCWPAGIVGSITHTQGYRAVAVSETAHAAAIGIDAEPNEPLPGTLLWSIGLPEERADVATLLRAFPGVCYDRLLFCTKEAVFKSWFSLTGRPLGFDGMVIRLEPGPWSGAFTAGLRTATDAGTRLTGRWLLAQNLLLTSLVIAASPPSPASDRVIPPAGSR